MNHYLVLCVILNLSFFINSVHSVTIAAKYDDENLKTVNFVTKQHLYLTCNVSDSNVELKWAKDGIDVDEVATLKGRTEKSRKGSSFQLKVKHSNDQDQGNYTCTAKVEGKSEEESAMITALAKVAIKVQSNINVVEGEKLTIHCNVVGRPKLSWKFENDTFNETYTESSGRIVLLDDTDKRINNAILKIEKVEMFDRGRYTCIATSENDDLATSTCMVRVKDQYAALWPFLGICAEVFILCAIIFIYEKKRNKTELEESDTDQSPDQKNTPDHAKDSNLRHRQ